MLAGAEGSFDAHRQVIIGRLQRLVFVRVELRHGDGTNLSDQLVLGDAEVLVLVESPQLFLPETRSYLWTHRVEDRDAVCAIVTG